MGEEQEDPTHTANFGVKLRGRCREAGVSCELVHPGAREGKHGSPTAFLIDTLTR